MSEPHLSPAVLGEADQVLRTQVDRLFRAQARVVEAAEERLEPFAARTLAPDGGQELAGLGAVDDDGWVDRAQCAGLGPLDPLERVGGKAPISQA